MVDEKISVKDTMVSNVITIEPSVVVSEAAKIMINKNIGGLIVIENKKPIGIITEKDFTSLIAEGKDPHKVKVKDAMSKPLITISPRAGLIDAAKLMTSSNVRKLPVLEDGNLIGIITAEDIVRVAPSEIELLLELAEIKAGSFGARKSSAEGECEICGNYSDSLYNLDGSFICSECREQQEE